jgi:hypothetical protein
VDEPWGTEAAEDAGRSLTATYVAPALSASLRDLLLLATFIDESSFTSARGTVEACGSAVSSPMGCAEGSDNNDDEEVGGTCSTLATEDS